MEDDIDIEEHNVLDNPRIKSIFPDLSRVKIEIADDDDGVVEEHYEMPIENAEGLYQYEYSFDNTEDNEEPLHYEEEEEEQEGQTYFFNNQIILGSKPPVDWDALKMEAETSHPVVDLEDWGPTLESSPCYCSTCAILFPTVNALDAHKMISHSYLVAIDLTPKNTARKSTVTSKYCHHCSKNFPDDTSLIKHLYELLPLNFPVKEEPGDSEMPKPKKSVIPFPKKVKSATPIQKNVKIEPKEELEPIAEVQKRRIRFKLPRDGKFFASSSLVPRGTLFQCNKCQIGFMSCFSALQHSKYCEKAMVFDKCGVCKRKIRRKDSAVHNLQHQTNDKLKIYTINKNIYDKVLCKCPKCLSCFDELGFWAHYSKCKKSERKSTRCPDCDVHIASTRYQLHRLKHTTKKLTKKDLIVIEFLDHPAKNLADIKLKAKEIKKKYKEKIKHTKQGADVVIYPHDIPLYYCDFCGCCQYKLSYKGHVDGICKGSKGKKYCEKCGLCFSAKSITSHTRLHAKRSFQLKDIKIFNLLNGKLMEPPIPDMYQCQKCAKHFLYHKNVRDHKCKQEKFITCKVCSKKFNVPAYRIHKKFHIVDEFIPELLKKYHSLQSVWDVIYMCQACEIVHTSYDSAVTHSQGHLNYIITDFHKMCYKCNLKVAEKEYHLHLNLHLNNVELGRDSFKCLVYNPTDLFKKDWMQLFSDLPEQDRRQILMKSAYRYTRSIRLQIESTSLTDNKKYFCMNCNTFMDGPALSSHLANNCAKNNEITCQECQVSYLSLQNLIDHDGNHEKMAEKYTIISFNNECDKAFNSHLRMLESKASSERKKQKEVPLSKLRELLLKDVTAKKGFKLYKCRNCNTCVSLKSSINRHNCIPKSERKFCKTCEQYFSVKKFQVHMEAHRKRPQIKKSNLHVVLFTGKHQIKDELSAKVFKCKCGLHFTSMKTVESHLDTCNSNFKVSKEKCSKCDLVFPTDLLVTHIINHHSKETKIDIVNVSKVTYFKCYACSIIYLDMTSFNSHAPNCDPKHGVKCPNCKLIFEKKSLAKHTAVCEGKTDALYIKKVITVKKIVKESTVYKCEQCDLCYLANNTYKYHANEANHKHKNPLPCNVCGLKFTNCSYQKHIKLHAFSNEDYKIKVVNGVTRQFYFMTGSNKIDDDVRSPKKRKLKTGNDDTSPTARKVQKIEQVSPKLRKNRSRIDEPSTSKANEDLIIPDQTPIVPKVGKDTPKSRRSRSKIDASPTAKDQELIVPDQISDHCKESDVSLTDKNESSDGAGLSNKLKSKIMVNKYGANLYKCLICNQHYMKDSSFDYHVKNHRKFGDTENFTCDVCGLDFSKHTLPRHKFVHHDKMKLKVEDFKIFTESPYSPAAEIRDKIALFQAQKESLPPEISPEILQNEESLTTSDKTTESLQNDQEMVYFKCSECNVCFVDAKMCFEHTNKHEILDPKVYIQCKICEFQFLIDSLKDHMTVHHKDDFSIEKLTIHEYSSQIGMEPKIETYKAIDKVQSRLVSTTTDVGVS
ncbi:zinc finger protein 91-like [Spodoptera frugiperda]|uniref:Zinc finger protein 91-like n=1 Tax=Spodoptera frugiperda TaxID=7108 RepID=A0A9R0DJS4_SPOFR|nr:zinc finger protein 91-like [Spodoptera frugiperda]